MLRRLISGLLLLGLLAPLAAQESPRPAPTPVQLTPTGTPTGPLPLTDLSSQLDDARGDALRITQELEHDDTLSESRAQLSLLVDEVESQSVLTRRRLADNPSLSDLEDMRQNWQASLNRIAAWKKPLSQRIDQLDQEVQALEEQTRVWSAASARPDLNDLPTDLRQRITMAVGLSATLRERAARSRSDLLGVLTAAGEQESAIKDLLATIENSRESGVRRIFERDSPALWNLDLSPLEASRLGPELDRSLIAQLQELERYSSRHSTALLWQLILVGLCYLGVNSARSRVQRWAAQEPSLQRAARIFQAPLATSLLCASLGVWVLPQPPPLLLAILGFVAIVPAYVVLRRLLPADLYPVLYGLVALFLVDQSRTLYNGIPLLDILLFWLELSAALLFMSWRLLLHRRAGLAGKPMQLLRWSVSAGFAIPWLALLLGFSRLGLWLGGALVQSTYLGFFLFALVQVVDGIGALMLGTPPLSRLASVRIYHAWYRHFLRRVVRTAAVFLWTMATLEMLALRSAALAQLSAWLSRGAKLGSISLTLGGLLLLWACVWIPLRLSRGVRLLLETDVYPRFHLSSGASYTLSTLIHYIFLATGLMLGLAVLGIDTSKITLVVGALGVGIGFGLQNIVNNFVSGIILLFERPIEVGHVIEVSGQTGRLQRIGLRASILRTLEGSELIVPNGELLSTRVTNWTLSDQRRVVQIQVGVGYGSEPAQVITLLTDAARAHPLILKDPEPIALFTNLGDNSLDFQMRAWTENFDSWAKTRSEILADIYHRLNQAGIDIPFPQRTLHIEPADRARLLPPTP